LIVRRRKVTLALPADPAIYWLEVCPALLKVMRLRIDDLFSPTCGHLQGAFSITSSRHRRCFPVIMQPKNIIENP
jgi:hypothetical protein